MASQEHLDILMQGVLEWNHWKAHNPTIKADLSGADLFGAKLQRADLRDVDFSAADLREADLSEAVMCHTDLSGARLCGANLFRADFFKARLTRANLAQANLEYSVLVETDLDQAVITGCRIYGMSVWNLKQKPLDQSNLIISCHDVPFITVDSLELAQFIFLLFNNKNIRDIIDTVTSKVVLILGRFTSERKAVLDALRDELSRRNYSPVLFDFDKPSSRDITETIATIAGMSRFIIADITEAKSIPQELQAIVPNLPSVAIQPIIAQNNEEYGMFEHFKRYPWVLPVYRYADISQLLASLGDKVIAPAEAKVQAQYS